MSTHLNADMRGSTSREDKKMTASVTIFHNVVWSRHKGAVLSALHNISGSGSIRYSMVQIADTEHDRLGFSDVDYSFHRYPMKKLYNGCYEDVPTWRMTARLTWEVLKAKSDLVVLPGYHRPEYWGMMVACILTGKRRAVFCDSTGRDRPRRMLTSIPKRVFFSLCDGYFGFGDAQPGIPDVARREAREDLHSVPGRRAAALVLAGDVRSSIAFTIGRAVRRCSCSSGGCRKRRASARLLDAFAGLKRRIPAASLRIVGTGPMGDPLQAEGRRYRPLRFRAFPRQPAGRALVARILRRCLHGAAEHERAVGPRHQRGAEPRLPGGRQRELRLRAGTGDRRRDRLRIPRGRCGRPCSARCSSRWKRLRIRRHVASRCVDVIQRFDPPSAAANIARGCALMLRD